MRKNKEQNKTNTQSNKSLKKFLTLYNDDINSFDHVIDSLINVCDHNDIQAAQCAYIAHHKGKVDVKKGSWDYLHPMKQELVERGLTVTIE